MFCLSKVSRVLPQVNSRFYSHGPSVSEIYAQYREFDQSLQKLNVSRISNPRIIDELVDEGSIPEYTGLKLKEQISKEKEAAAQAEKWTKIFIYIGIPTIILTAINAYFIESEHISHYLEHPREIVPYSYLRIRTKKFFWGDGDHTIFHNPMVNGP